MGSTKEPWTVSPDDAPSAVRVYLWDTRQRETIQHRIVCLSPPAYELKIGRGSQSEQCLRPTEDNAWFTARVMSRDHAILRADAEAKQITLEDTGSMHGTYINGVRLEQGRRVVIRDDTTVRFGAEIVRGELTYDPLDLQIHYIWPDAPNSTATHPRLNEFLRSRNSFSVDYSEDEANEEDDEEDENDDDIKFVYESIRVNDPELGRQSRTFSVPDSDISDSSIVDQEDTHSAPSSPVETTTSEVKDKIPAPIVIEAEEKSSVVPGSTFQSALNLSDDEAEDGNPDEADVHQESHDQDPSEDEHESFDEELDEELEEGPDGEEDEAFNDMSESSCRYPASTTQANTSIRAPSPSDAALPKPWYPQSEVPALPIFGPAAHQNLTYHQHFSAESAVASPGQPFSYYNGMNWLVNGDSNGNFTSSYPQAFCAPPARRSTPWRCPYPNPRDTMDAANAKVAAAAADNLSHTKLSKVSINDIIENVTADPPNDPESRKRKADEISTSIVEEECMLGAPEAMSPEGGVPESNAIQTESATEIREDSADHTEKVIPSMTEAQSEWSSELFALAAKVEREADAVADVIDEDRSRKKVKVEHSPRGNALLKYAATAVVGAAVGAVSTVFGLAALPAEYFA